MKASDFTEKRVQKLVKQSQEGILQQGVDAAGEAVDQGTEQLEGLGQQIVDAAKENPEEAAAAIGATGGGALGGLVSDENRLLKALVGAAMGGGAGYGGANLLKGTNSGIQDDLVQSDEGGLSTGEKAGIGAGAVGAGVGGDFLRNLYKDKNIKFPDRAYLRHQDPFNRKNDGMDMARFITNQLFRDPKWNRKSPMGQRITRATKNTGHDLKRLLTLGMK